MQKHFAIAAALVVVGIFFYGDKLPLIKFTSPFPSYDSVRTLAWQTFEQYRTYATEGNLEGVKSVSHQVSETCKNPETREECNQLMSSVALFTSELREEDFQEVYYDDKQIVLLSKPIENANGDVLTQVILLFTKTSTGEPKVLGMRFCFKGKAEENKSCFNSDPATRDLNQNGWWDIVESLFYK